VPDFRNRGGVGGAADSGGGSDDSAAGADTGSDPAGGDDGTPDGSGGTGGFDAPDRGNLGGGDPTAGTGGDAGVDDDDEDRDRPGTVTRPDDDDADFRDPRAPGGGRVDPADPADDSQTRPADDSAGGAEFEDAGLEEDAGAITGREDGFADAVQRLQGRISRTTPLSGTLDTEEFNIVREGDRQLGVEFSADARDRISEARIEAALQSDADATASVPSDERIEQAADPADLPGLVAADTDRGFRPAPAAREQERTAEIQALAEGLRADVAAETPGVEPSDVDLQVEDGRLIAESPEPIPTDQAAGAGVVTDRLRRPDGAAGSQDLEPALAGRFADVSESVAQADESALASGFEARAEAAAEERAATDEEFGDIPIASPVSDNRLEEDLAAGAEVTRTLFTAAAELGSRGQAPGSPFQALSGVRRAEQTGLGLADRFGLIDAPGDGEGELERAAESGAVASAGILNLPSAAAEGKEIAEFGLTQPPRIADTLTAVDIETAAAGPTTGPIITDVDTSEAAETEFARDVRNRVTAVAETAEREARADPLGTSAAVAGGLLGSLAVGTGVGRAAARLPLVSGSDLSGRVLTGAARAAQRGGAGARRFAADRRGQVTLGGDAADAADEITREDLVGERFSEPPGVARARRARRRGRRQAREAMAEADRGTDVDITRFEDQDADITREANREIQRGDAGVSSSTVRRQQEAFARSVIADDDDLTPLESQLAAELETPSDDLRRVAAPVTGEAGASGVFTLRDVSAGVAGSGLAAEGLLGDPADAERDAAGRSVDESDDAGIGAGIDSDSGADVDAATDVFAETRTGGDVREGADSLLGIDARADLRENTRFDSRQDARQDARQDIRQDTRQDLRFDTRQDTRQDVRTDLRFDTRFDTRADAPADARDDDDDEDPLDSAFGVVANPFSNPVETAEEFLGDSP
jgi:hypothetical protein